MHVGNVYTNLGENRFTVVDTWKTVIIFYGWTDTSVHNYSEKTIAGILVTIRNQSQTDLYRRTGSNRNRSNKHRLRQRDKHKLTFNGISRNGMYDTAYVSPDTSNSNLTEEELLYNQGQNYIVASMFTEGISALKNLTDTYNYFMICLHRFMICTAVMSILIQHLFRVTETRFTAI